MIKMVVAFVLVWITLILLAVLLEYVIHAYFRYRTAFVRVSEMQPETPISAIDKHLETIFSKHMTDS